MLQDVRFGGMKFVILIAVCLIPLLAGPARADSESGKSNEGGPGLLEIRMKGAEKMPPVPFPHAGHTKNIESENVADGNCLVCHLKKDGKLIFDFRNADVLGYEGAMALYHDECGGCHKKMKAKGETSGPMISSCRECHREEKVPAPAWQPLDFDRSLHYRHVTSPEIRFMPQVFDTNCGACHHVYDEQLKKTVYKEGEEGSCQYCHKAVKTDDTRSWPNAAHAMCVNCHLDERKQNKKAGPVECAGCHSRQGQAKIETISEVPRLKWKQPDAVLLIPWLKEAVKLGKLPEQLTDPVVFNHKAHEAVTGKCRQCHHASMEPCAKCHTTRGSKEGDFIPLERAMHEKKSNISCVGCHQDAMWQPDCAGCHARMANQPFADMECRRCHSIDPQQLKTLPVTDAERKQIAETVVQNRDLTQQMVPEKDIPEKVKIDIMSDVYQPAEFPHRKIVLALAEKTGKSKLAAWFHDKPETLCMGCHHNSPASLRPPRCVSCHALSGAGTAEERPALKGAYHGQCIGCHIKMNIEKPSATDCIGCHKQATRNMKQETENTEVRQPF